MRIELSYSICAKIGSLVHWFIVNWITVIVFLRVCLGLLSRSYNQCWILLLVWFFGLKRFDHITHALMDLHWLPYPQRITYKLCMIMFKCLRDSAPANLADYCTNTSLVPGRLAVRSAAHDDIVVPSHRTDWGLRSFAVAGPSSWNVLPVGLRSSSFSLDTFAKHLKTHLFGLAYSRQSTHFWVCITFCRVRHGDSVTKPDYYYYIKSLSKSALKTWPTKWAFISWPTEWAFIYLEAHWPMGVLSNWGFSWALLSRNSGIKFRQN